MFKKKSITTSLTIEMELPNYCPGPSLLHTGKTLSNQRCLETTSGHIGLVWGRSNGGSGGPHHVVRFGYLY